MNTYIALVLIALLSVLAFVVVPGILEYLSSRQKQYGYTVWVGGVEVNDYYFARKEDARRQAQQYIDDGYDDVQVERVIL